MRSGSNRRPRLRLVGCEPDHPVLRVVDDAPTSPTPSTDDPDDSGPGGTAARSEAVLDALRALRRRQSRDPKAGEPPAASGRTARPPISPAASSALSSPASSPSDATPDADRLRFGVERENRKAASELGLAPNDPRWVLAVRVASQLEGTMLTPERRERVMRTARHLGVRPFDAGLVIAMVQDRARRGQLAGPLRPQLAELASPIRPPARHRWVHGRWARFLAALAAATLVNLLLIRWLTGD